jgi:hypothetical protein
MENEKSLALFYGAIAVTIVALLLCIYYAIPNINHLPIPVDAEPTKVHYKYIELCGSLAVLGVIGALITLVQKLLRSKR